MRWRWANWVMQHRYGGFKSISVAGLRPMESYTEQVKRLLAGEK